MFELTVFLHQKQPTHFTEVLLKMSELQALLQLGAVALPEIVERRLCFVQLTQESERTKRRIYSHIWRQPLRH